MGRHRDGHQRLVGLAADEAGQATVEYAVVAGALVAIVLACALLARALGDGMFVDHALAAASHHVRAAAGWVADVFCY